MSELEVQAHASAPSAAAVEDGDLTYYKEKLDSLAREIRQKVPERRTTGKWQRAGSWIAGGVVGLGSAATGVIVLTSAGIPAEAAGVVLLVSGGLTALSPKLPLDRGRLNIATAVDLEAVARDAEDGARTCSNAAAARELSKVLHARRDEIEKTRI